MSQKRLLNLSKRTMKTIRAKLKEHFVDYSVMAKDINLKVLSTYSHGALTS